MSSSRLAGDPLLDFDSVVVDLLKHDPQSRVAVPQLLLQELVCGDVGAEAEEGVLSASRQGTIAAMTVRSMCAALRTTSVSTLLSDANARVTNSSILAGKSSQKPRAGTSQGALPEGERRLVCVEVAALRSTWTAGLAAPERANDGFRGLLQSEPGLAFTLTSRMVPIMRAGAAVLVARDHPRVLDPHVGAVDTPQPVFVLPRRLVLKAADRDRRIRSLSSACTSSSQA